MNPMIGESSFPKLRQAFSNATETASSAMSTWTSGQIQLTLDEFSEIPLSDVASELGIGEDLLTIVLLDLHPPLAGQFILTFDNENGRRLASCVLSREQETGEEWSALEQSAVKETGNIVICAYVNRLQEMIGEDLIPSPPYLVQDFGASVLEQALMEQAMESDTVLLCRTGFSFNDQELSWNLIFIPSIELLHQIEQTQP